MKTSFSDADEYRQFCRRAAEDDALFASFREHSAFRFVVMNELPYAGLDCWQLLGQRGFDFSFFDRIRDLDEVGQANRIEYEHAGAVAPQTMRYVKVLSDLELLFGSLDGKTV